ncbi:O-methyltransferase [Occallatibacter savannae]|uniref:O-methyltransferase n=1 Tax=Occallatibacter savannae TaxID=1002691 RepID=UPI001EF7333A|nr:O-methyltransferase [Occallatibacter savannae]
MPDKPIEIWDKVDSFFTDALIPPDPALDAATAANRNAALPAIDVTPLQGRFLELMIRATAAQRVLEIGTLGGYSTIWMARAVGPNGKVITLELDPHHAEVAQRNFQEAGVSDRIELRLGPASESLAALIREKSAPFDFIFIDADKSGYPEYIQQSLKLSRPGTLIIADNVVRDGKVIEPHSPDPNIQGVRRFTELIAAQPRLSSTVLQTVGSKGYDGLAISIVLS